MFECCKCKKDCKSAMMLCFDCAQSNVKIFPIDVDNEQGKLYQDIIKFLLDYKYNEKYPDINTRRYAMDILELFNEFINDCFK